MTPPASLARPLPEPRAALGLREGYHSAQVPAEVRLNTNESPYPPPPEWLEAVTEAARDIAFNRYPDRSAWALRQALAQLHGVRPEQVFAANGSNEVLQLLCLAYGGAGRKAAMFEPTYALHAHIAHLTGTEIVQGRRRPDFTLATAAALELVEKASPSIVFLCSPNNPTGLAEDQAVVSAVVAASPGLVVVDEAYGQFASWSALELVDDGVPLVVVRTYSKTWSMAGLRLGYADRPGGGREGVGAGGAALPPGCPETGRRPAGVAIFRTNGRAAWPRSSPNGNAWSTELSRLPVKVWPSQANFVLWRPLLRRGAEVWEGLVQRSVLVRDTSSWPGLEGCLRTTVGTPAENDRFLSALAEVLA